MRRTFIYPQVVIVVGEDALEVETRLVVGEQLDEEGFVGRGAAEPDVGVAGAGVVTDEGGYVVVVGDIARPAQVVCAETDVDGGKVEQVDGVVGVVEALCDLRPGAGDDLGETLRAGKGTGGPSTTSSANAYGAASNVRTSISTSMTRLVSCGLGYPPISTSTTMRDHIKVPTIARRRKSSSCSVQSRPHSPKCTLVFPFRGPTIVAHHTSLKR